MEKPGTAAHTKKRAILQGGILPKSGGEVRANKEREPVRQRKRGGYLNVPIPMGLAQYGRPAEKICTWRYPSNHISCNGPD